MVDGDAAIEIEAVESTSTVPDEVSAVLSPSTEAGPSQKMQMKGKSGACPLLNDAIVEGERIPPTVRIDWHPSGCTWQFSIPKIVLRKQPQFKKFHSFLIFETEVGNLLRQEAVSMIPPSSLTSSRTTKFVMDMCTAPGSKTAQILEALHAQDTSTSSSIPSGVTHHQRQRQQANPPTNPPVRTLATAPLIVTNLDASNHL
ncbi:hypothetical protein DFP72DRAFT_1083996 [Ephemerocybe angulata]|uniref:SAM-dependent MTase RsmB/NOP-type domain-containing protein n=1 Tax=Ephemerocybe angulata TaxID=980116 RepID=A0A8H6H6K9_9AGAR|nr:hypothetical protein DFP72DRAFT_1083996 [Tulosesus angulatus]